MREDPDFTAYVVARWTPVVKVLVMLGLPPDRAEDAAVNALARMLPDWRRLRREGDVDVELARFVLDGWVRARSDQAEPVPVPVPAGRLLTQELEQQLALLARLGDGLARLDDTARVTVVLHHLGELDVAQTAEVLGERPYDVSQRLAAAATSIDLGPLDATCHSAASAIEVSPPPVTRVVARATAGRRRLWLVTSAAVLALVLVAGAAYVFTRPPPAPKPPPALSVTPVDNPLGAAWWVAGTLHLEHGTAHVLGLTQLVETGIGVVYSDAAGDVVSVAEDGARRRLGAMDPATALVSQPATGLVAWLQPATDGSAAHLVVYDAIAQRQLGQVARAADTRLIGWDRDLLFYHTKGADWTLQRTQPSGIDITQVDPPEGEAGSTLQDVAAGAELRELDGTLSVVQPFFSVTMPIGGDAGQLSPDGDFVLTRTGDGTVAAYDVRSGKLQRPFFDTGLMTPVAAAFTSASRAIWVADTHDGSYAMFDCQVDRRYINSFDPNSPCTPRVDVGDVPLLAGVWPGLVPTPAS